MGGVFLNPNLSVKELTNRTVTTLFLVWVWLLGASENKRDTCRIYIYILCPMGMGWDGIGWCIYKP